LTLPTNELGGFLATATKAFKGSDTHAGRSLDATGVPLPNRYTNSVAYWDSKINPDSTPILKYKVFSGCFIRKEGRSINGILFKPDMIKAIVEKRKTQTRRLSGLKEINENPNEWHFACLSEQREHLGSFIFDHINNKPILIKPRYHLNEIVYIKEPHYAYGFWNYKDFDSGKTEWTFHRYQQTPAYPVYFNDTKPKDLIVINGHSTKCGWYLRSPMFIFEKEARYHIKITNIKVQHLNNMTEDDAHKEGCNNLNEYKLLWDNINKKEGYQWKNYPWVWIYNFCLYKAQTTNI
jgi:hypothetical protein